MSYQVIARKYRPQTFAEVTGQEHITRTLTQALEAQRLHHAYLFSGVRGTGKTTSARLLAKGLNCATGITSRPCLSCASCSEIAAGNSIDVLEIDAASNTGVDNVRDVIINNIAVSPARDRFKVFIIDEVHMLSASAFNALLKTLEEPPSHVVFIMATTELHKVPETILSRCQQFEFRQIPIHLIEARLAEIAQAEGIRITDAARREVARAGAGSLRDAQSALDQVIAFSGDEITEEDVVTALGVVSAAILSQFIEAIADADSAALLRLVEELTTRGYDLRNFTRELMTQLRHLLVIKSGLTEEAIPAGEIARLRELAARFSEEDLVRCFHLLASTEKEIKDSPHPRFQLELGLIKLTHALRLRPLDELISRLEALEARLNSAPAASSEPSPAPAPVRTPTSKSRPKTEPAAPPPPLKTASPPPEIAAPPDDWVGIDFSAPEEFEESETPPPPSRRDPAPVTKPEEGEEVAAILAELLRLNRTMLQTALEDAESVLYRDGRLVVRYASENVMATRLRSSGALFREIGERLFGRALLIEVVAGGEAAAPPALTIDPEEQAREQRRQRAMEHPKVRMLLEKLRGEIVEVREAPPR